MKPITAKAIITDGGEAVYHDGRIAYHAPCKKEIGLILKRQRRFGVFHTVPPYKKKHPP